MVGLLDSLNPAFSGSDLTNSPTLGWFIANYDSEGHLIWTHSVGTYAAFNAVAVDSQGCVYAAGIAMNSNTFGQITITNSPSSGAALLVKYDPAGNVLWATQSMNAFFSGVAAITVDAQDNAYITGQYFSYSNIVFGTQMLTDSGSYTAPNYLFDVFTVKYAPTGEALWARRAVGLNQTIGHMITVDAESNVFLASPFPGIADFGGATLTSVGPKDFALAKYNATGDLLWAKRVAEGNFGYIQAAADNAGNIYASSFFNGETASFGNNTVLTGMPSTQKIFLAKYDEDGNFLWVKEATPSGLNYAEGLCVDALGNSYFAGSFASTNLVFGNLEVPKGPHTFGSLFVAKHDSEGNLLWLKSPPDADAAPCAIGSDKLGNVYMAGRLSNVTVGGQPYSRIADFGGFTITNDFANAIFVARLDGPKLSITPTSSQIRISWPTNAAGLHLESATSLNGPWSLVANSVVANGNQKTVTIETPSSNRFFRLNGP